MRTMIIVGFMMVLAVSAQAGIIYDIQTGVYNEGQYLTPIELVVVAVTGEGIFVSEAPHSAYNGIYVYTGPHTWVPGNFVSICSVYNEFEGLSQLDVLGTGAWGSVTWANGYGEDHVEPIPEPSYVTAEDLLADEEKWESCQITITDGMEVTETDLGNGEWISTCEDSNLIRFDDFWVDFSTVMRGSCYSNATGIYFYSRDTFKLEAYPECLHPVSCAVENEIVSLSTIKALYR